MYHISFVLEFVPSAPLDFVKKSLNIRAEFLLLNITNQNTVWKVAYCFEGKKTELHRLPLPIGLGDLEQLLAHFIY